MLTAAGNNDSDACGTSPAGSPFTITVGAVDASRNRMRTPGGSGSNYGPCVDLYAPGENVHGASASGDNAGVVLSGTSQAVALAAGAAAMHLHSNPRASPAQLRQALVSAASSGVVDEGLSAGPSEYTAPLLQVAELGAPPRAALTPPQVRMRAGMKGLKLAYSMALQLQVPAKAPVRVALGERSGLRLNTPSESTLPAGSSGGAFDLVVNETIALSTTAADSFFVDVALSSDDPAVDGRMLAVQARRSCDCPV